MALHFTAIHDYLEMAELLCDKEACLAKDKVQKWNYIELLLSYYVRTFIITGCPLSVLCFCACRMVTLLCTLH